MRTTVKEAAKETKALIQIRPLSTVLCWPMLLGYPFVENNAVHAIIVFPIYPLTVVGVRPRLRLITGIEGIIGWHESAAEHSQQAWVTLADLRFPSPVCRWGSLSGRLGHRDSQQMKERGLSVLAAPFGRGFVDHTYVSVSPQHARTTRPREKGPLIGKGPPFN